MFFFCAGLTVCSLVIRIIIIVCVSVVCVHNNVSTLICVVFLVDIFLAPISAYCTIKPTSWRGSVERVDTHPRATVGIRESIPGRVFPFPGIRESLVSFPGIPGMVQCRVVSLVNGFRTRARRTDDKR